MIARRLLAAAVLLFGIVVLVLNLGEKDYYDLGSLEPPRDAGVPDDDATFHRLVPEELAHPCTTCGDCTHRLQTLENRRVLSVIDRDGWYKLFWAGRERYYYDDPPALAAAMLNSTAGPVLGSWSIRLRPGPPTHGSSGTHECGELPPEVALEYELFSSPEPAPERLVSVGPFRVLEQVTFLTYAYDRPHLPSRLHFGWRLVKPPETRPGRCPCGKP